MNEAIERRSADVVVIGTGVAGLACALELAGMRVDLLTKTTLSSGSSLWAQGGVAVAMGAGDSPELHAADTVAAGAGLVDPAIAELLAEEGVTAVRRLIELGAEFDRSAKGELDFGREAAHSRRRILHAHGDSTGAELVRALAERLRTAPWVSRFEGAFAPELGGAAEGPGREPADGAQIASRTPGRLLDHPRRGGPPDLPRPQGPPRPDHPPAVALRPPIRRAARPTRVGKEGVLLPPWGGRAQLPPPPPPARWGWGGGRARRSPPPPPRRQAWGGGGGGRGRHREEEGGGGGGGGGGGKKSVVGLGGGVWRRWQSRGWPTPGCP